MKKKKINDYHFYECAESRCLYDNLTIYNKAGVFDDQTKHFVGSYCGNNVPRPMTFMDSVMMILKTDYFYTFTGFEIQYAIQSKKINLILIFQTCNINMILIF